MPVSRRSSGWGLRNARILGIVLMALGGVAIGFGWSGMARVDCDTCQLPYLLSGGATGLGLIFIGSVLLILAQIRTAQDSFRDQVRQINQAMVRMAGMSSGGGNGHAVVAGQST